MKTMEKDEVVLNDLIKINNDRTEGYEKAIKETKEMDDDLRSTFKKMADESRKYSQELQKHASNGDNETTTNAGKIYRAWMDVKTTASGNTRESVLSACEFGEDAAQKAYKDALETKEISIDVKDIIRKQQAALKSSHDLIKQWRDREKNKTGEKKSSL